MGSLVLYQCSVLIQYHKTRTQLVEQINLEEEPVELIQLSVFVTDSCREQKESNGVWGHYILQLITKIDATFEEKALIFSHACL